MVIDKIHSIYFVSAPIKISSTTTARSTPTISSTKPPSEEVARSACACPIMFALKSAGKLIVLVVWALATLK